MKLSFTNGPRNGEIITLQPPGVCIGREEDNDIQLLVAGVSRYHAKIAFDGVKWSISDLDSTNGTKVNSQKITQATVLNPGDVLTLGDQTLLFGDIPADPHKVETLKNMNKSDILPVPPAPIPEPVPAQKNENPIPLKPAHSTPPPPAVAPVIAPPPAEIPGKKTPESPDIPKLPGTNIFGKKEENPYKKDPSTDAGKGRKEGKWKHSYLVFAVLVIALAAFVVAAFIKIYFLEKNETATLQPEKKQIPEFIIDYDRVRTEPDNVFRFAFTLENGVARFTLDDLKYGRHFEKKFENINPKILKELEDSVRETEFLKLKQEPLAALVTDKTDEQKRLTVLIDNKQNTITVRNTYAQNSFESIERAIDRFAGSNGISSVAMNVEEMRKYAYDTFRKAEDLFNNYEAKPENLREAIIRYKLAMEYLEQFSPKPREWDIARKRCADAENIYDRSLKDIAFNIQRYSKLQQWNKASEECQKGMEMVPPDSKQYLDLKKYKLVFDKNMRK